VKNGISYRMPNHQKLLQLISLTGPLYSSSANLSGQNTISDYTDAITIFAK